MEYYPASFPFTDWCTKKRKRNTALSSHKSRGPKKVLEKAKRKKETGVSAHSVLCSQGREHAFSDKGRKAPSLSFPDSLKLLHQRPGSWSAGTPREEDHWCTEGPPCSPPYDINNSSIYPEVLTMNQNRTLAKQASQRLRIHHNSIYHFKLGSSHAIWGLHDKVCIAHGCENAPF